MKFILVCEDGWDLIIDDDDLYFRVSPQGTQESITGVCTWLHHINMLYN